MVYPPITYLEQDFSGDMFLEIPEEICDKLDLIDGQGFEVTVERDRIILTPAD